MGQPFFAIQLFRFFNERYACFNNSYSYTQILRATTFDNSNDFVCNRRRS